MPEPLNLVVLGPPGAGKTTQAERLAQIQRVPFVSAGDLLREQVRARTALGKAVEPYLTRGQLVPDEYVVRLVKQRLARPDVERNFVLDGFPRTLGEAEALDTLLQRIQRPLTHVLLLQVPDAEVLDRLRGRLVCPDCGSVFHARRNPPVPGTLCPACRTVLHVTDEGRIQCTACRDPIGARPDDRPEAIQARLDAFYREMAPVLAHYQTQGLLRVVDGSGSEEDVFARILGQLGEDVTVPQAEPTKRPVGVHEGLRYGMDIDGTITRAPRHFKRLIDALLDHGDEVYIVTGRPESIRPETEHLLTALGIRSTALLMRPDDWSGTIASFKVRAVQEKRLHLTIDDDQRNCWAINEQTEALAAHMLPFPETSLIGVVGALVGLVLPLAKALHRILG